MNITTYLLLNSITHYILLSDYSLLLHSLLLLIYHELDHKHTSLHSHLSTHNFVTTYHPIHHFITLDIKSSTFISLYFQLLYLNHTFTTITTILWLKLHYSPFPAIFSYYSSTYSFSYFHVAIDSSDAYWYHHYYCYQSRWWTTNSYCYHLTSNSFFAFFHF